MAVLATVLVAILVVGVAGTVLFFTRTYPPLRAAWDFTDEIREGDVDDAFEQVCRRVRGPGTRAGFERFARDLQQADTVSVDLFSVDRDGSSATVDLDVTDGDRQLTVELRLVDEDGDWRPCGTRSR